ncbi:MAG: aspartyl/glutamyl-tRNA(Asn/Gln) amidotransferase subunit B [Myxococcales bacterium]
MTTWETVIGLEVHAQLKTATKIFCGCRTTYGEMPNVQTCPVCLGMPGVLPVLNGEALRMAVMAGVATGCRIRSRCRFARKNYFYPDLPKGYQISQFDEPLCEEGSIDIDVEQADGTVRTKRAGLIRIHMEEDAGKTVHDTDRHESRVDLNRAGVPLIEIVGKPDLRSPDEAVAYLKTLRNIVRYLDICDGNLEEGSFRCDANVSIRPLGSDTFGTRTELKNINSFRNVHRALCYEVERQREVLEGGGTVRQETRLWNADLGRTEPMRSKEEAHDYRYFPEPDLLPVEVSQEWVEALRAALPELPDQKRRRFMEAHGLSPYDASVLVSAKELADYYEAVLAEYGGEPKKAVNWITTELLGALAKEGREIPASPVPPGRLARILTLMDDGTISGKMAKDVFARVYEGADPDDVVASMGSQITDAGAITEVVRRVIAESPKQLEQLRAGRAALRGYFVGQVMKATGGKANPQVVNEILDQELGA